MWIPPHIEEQSCSGKTVAVLGCGFGTNYLMGNKSLRNSIKQKRCFGNGISSVYAGK